MASIDILTINGSPTGVTPLEIEDKGVGGAELSLLRLADGLANRGHRVRVYNDPRHPYDTNNLSFYPRDAFVQGEHRNVLISFRGPHPLALNSNRDKHIGFSCDQFTEGDYDLWYRIVDKMVLISPFHKSDHEQRYKQFDAEKAIITDLGVTNWEYEEDLPKKDKQVIFCSVPDRGLDRVATIWPRVLEYIPDASLVITSDYRLWGIADPMNMQYKLKFVGIPGVKFLGKIPRTELVAAQKQSEVHLYPCTYEELFNISTAETQSAGALALTSGIGAIKTTNFTGKILHDDDEFVEETVRFLRLPKEQREQIQKEIKAKALARFSWNKILDFWEKEIIHG